MPNLAGSFDFEIEVDCDQTKLVEHDQIETHYEIYALEPRVQSHKYLAYSDEISDLNNKSGTCGQIIYTILDSYGDIVVEDLAMARV